MRHGPYIDTDAIYKLIVSGRSVEEACAKMGVSVRRYKMARAAAVRGEFQEDEAIVRARWEKMLPKMRARIKSEMLSDPA